MRALGRNQQPNTELENQALKEAQHTIALPFDE